MAWCIYVTSCLPVNGNFNAHVRVVLEDALICTRLPMIFCYIGTQLFSVLKIEPLLILLKHKYLNIVIAVQKVARRALTMSILLYVG